MTDTQCEELLDAVLDDLDNHRPVAVGSPEVAEIVANWAEEYGLEYHPLAAAVALDGYWD